MVRYSNNEIKGRVASARNSGWESLGLMQCRVMDADLIKLLHEPGVEQLRLLRLGRNLLTTLPPEIGQLTALTMLSLGNNRLTTLPPEVGQLTALTTLHLWDNQLTTLPPEIGQLTALTTLELNQNRLTTLLPEIGQLTALTHLNLDANQLSTLPPELGQLTALTELYLAFNQLSTLPPEFGRLTALTTLSFRNNQISTLPPEIGQLTALTELGIEDNQLSKLPPEFGQLTALTRLFLHGNDGLGIPPEVLGPTWEKSGPNKPPAAPAAILDYYFSKSKRALNEVKVILVGQGAVGKTSIVKRMVYNTYNPGEEKTEGIYIEKAWGVPGKKGERVQVNFWDFGGQEIMHATHQFFLTKRSLYVLVLDARKGENESNIHQWLKIISSFGGDSPILVVTNKCEEHHIELNETRLKKDYPAIRGFFKTSCETPPAGIAELKAAIEDEIRNNMPHVFDLLPLEYFTIKEELEALAAQRNHISTREYYALCQQHGIEGLDHQDRLLRFLHDLGSVLCFNDPDSPYALRETSVLNPEWVTQGVYQVLNKQNTEGCNGVLTRDDLRRILDPKAYPDSSYQFIVDMMQKFELCFASDPHGRWLVPELLHENEPAGLEAPPDKSLNLQYHYQILPAGIISRFIVRRYENLGKPPVYWRSGVQLHFDGCTAVVRSDKDNGRMFISVRGPEKCLRGALAVIRDEFSRIHATISNLLPDERVPLPDKPEVTVSYKHLLRLEEARQIDTWPEGAEHEYTVAQLLDGIEDAHIRGWNRFGYNMLQPPLFVIEPETSFPEAWEVFCCGVLNRYHKTSEIYQRKPPEGGIDLYWPAKKVKIAYQCKSVEKDGGSFNITNALESIDAALKTREHLPWDKYVLCSNVVLTGEQERKLRAKLGDGEFELHGPSFWQPRCIEQREHLRDRFNVLASVDRDGRMRDIDLGSRNSSRNPTA